MAADRTAGATKGRKPDMPDKRSMAPRRALIMLMISAAAALLAPTSPADATGKSILWVQPMRDHPVHRLMQAGFLAKCKELGDICEIVGNPSATDYDVTASIPLAEAAMARTKFDAIAVYGPGPEIFPFITKLGRQGFPVVTWHVLPPEGKIPGLKAATGEDIPVAGRNAALSMGEKLGGHGVIALTQGSSNDTENVMSDSFRAAIAEKFPGIRVLDTQMEGFEPSAAVAKGCRHPAGQSGCHGRLLDHRQRRADLVGRGAQGGSRAGHRRHGLYPPESGHREVRRGLSAWSRSRCTRKAPGRRSWQTRSRKAGRSLTSTRSRPR